MTRITDKLPFEHKSTWQKLCYEKHKRNSHETFRDLEIFLKDTIAYVNMVKHDHLFFSTTINKANDNQAIDIEQNIFMNTEDETVLETFPYENENLFLPTEESD
jgi:hypothetical protein